MAGHRKPIPGQDSGEWGDILNDYLSVSLDPNGSLNSGVVADSQIASGASIAESKLDLASDAAANVPSRRTLGTSPTQAAAGNDSRIVGAEQIANKNQANGYPGLDGSGGLDVPGAITAGASSSIDSHYLRIGPTAYGSTLPADANSAYAVIDKANTGSDSSVVFRDQGNIRAEIGLAGDNNIHLKTVTGTMGAEVFTDRLVILTNGNAWFVNKLGVGASPVEQLHVAASGISARTLFKVENTNGGAGTVGAGLQFTGTGVDWMFGTDAGLNGGNNFFIQDNAAGYPPRLLIDASGNVVIGSDTATYKLTITGGDIATVTAGAGLRIKEGANAKMGVVTLVAGVATVNTTAVTSNSRIFLTTQSPGGTVGTPYISARTAGASFTVTSTSNTDTSIVAWHIIEPS